MGGYGEGGERGKQEGRRGGSRGRKRRGGNCWLEGELSRRMEKGVVGVYGGLVGGDGGGEG